MRRRHHHQRRHLHHCGQFGQRTRVGPAMPLLSVVKRPGRRRLRQRTMVLILNHHLLDPSIKSAKLFRPKACLHKRRVPASAVIQRVCTAGSIILKVEFHPCFSPSLPTATGKLPLPPPPQDSDQLTTSRHRVDKFSYIYLLTVASSSRQDQNGAEDNTNRPQTPDEVNEEPVEISAEGIIDYYETSFSSYGQSLPTPPSSMTIPSLSEVTASPGHESLPTANLNMKLRPREESTTCPTLAQR